MDEAGSGTGGGVVWRGVWPALGPRLEMEHRAKGFSAASARMAWSKEGLNALVQEPTAQCTRPNAMNKAQVVQQEARLEFGTESSLDDTPAAKLENELGGDLFVLAIRCRCLR